MAVLGALNSRMKDFYDLYVILNHMNVDDQLVGEAIEATFARRNVPLPQELPIAFTPDFMEGGLKETHWQAFLHRSSLTSFDLSLTDVLTNLRERLWPVLCSLAGS